MIKMFTEKMLKVTAEYAKDYYAKATNNGWRAEALALRILHCTAHNPYLSAELGGDVFSPKYGNVQVKYANGRIPGAVDPNNLEESLRKAFEADASPTWMIFFTLDEYVIIDKWELFKIMTNKFNRKKFFRNDNGLRLTIGIDKKMYFKNVQTVKF